MGTPLTLITLDDRRDLQRGDFSDTDAESVLFRAAAAADGPQRDHLTQQLVLRHLGLAESIAARFTHGTQDGRDIRQVAAIGLIKAVQRFDPDRGFPFAAFAAPTISGEIKRYLRDSTWIVRPPRSVLEMAITLADSIPRLSQELRRDPTTEELAAHLGANTKAIAEGLRGANAMYSLSLDMLSDGAVAEDLLCTDPAEWVESHVELERALATLTERQRRIIHLRFVDGLAQREIADDLGVTQMQVSRLISGILAQLRRLMAEEPTTERTA
jgi:RNA polymerase sigma-B factor